VAFPFQVLTLNTEDLTERAVGLTPKPWTSDEAKLPGGIWYSVIKSAFGAVDYELLQQLVFLVNLCRISTATDVGLDIISEDFFGDNLPRLPGEDDEAFRQRIKDNLLKPKVTRQAISDAIEEATGYKPRMIEPFLPDDTCAWDADSYWDLDSVREAFRWGDPGLAWQGFIIAQLPLFSVTGGQPVYCWDAGFSWDVPQSAWFDVAFEISPTAAASIEKIIKKYKAEGTLIWLALQPPQVPFVRGSLGLLPFEYSAQHLNMADNLRWLEGVIPVLIFENPTWNTRVWTINDTDGLFSVEINIPNNTPTVLNWMALRVASDEPQPTIPAGGLHVEVPEGVMTLRVPLTQYFFSANSSFAFTPSWNTVVYADLSVSLDYVDLYFDTIPIGAQHVHMALFNRGDKCRMGIFNVNGGAYDATISFIATPQVIKPPYHAYAVPDWNTTVALQKQTSNFICSFDVPAPAGGGRIYWTLEID